MSLTRCKNCDLPPECQVLGLSSLDIDSIYLNTKYDGKRADCLVMDQDGITRFIVEVKGVAMKDAIKQLEATVEELIEGRIPSVKKVNKDGLSAIIIMKKFGAEKLYERDSNYNLKRKGGNFIKINNKIMIKMYEKSEIEKMINNDKLWKDVK